MKELPSTANVSNDKEFCALIHHTSIQASNRVKAAVKNGAVPFDSPIKWILGSGHYFIIRAFGPYTQDELDTRLHHPNDSGDWLVTELNQENIDDIRTRTIQETVLLIGTAEAAEAVHEYLIEGMELYDHDPQRRHIVELVEE